MFDIDQSLQSSIQIHLQNGSISIRHNKKKNWMKNSELNLILLVVAFWNSHIIFFTAKSDAHKSWYEKYKNRHTKTTYETVESHVFWLEKLVRMCITIFLVLNWYWLGRIYFLNGKTTANIDYYSNQLHLESCWLVVLQAGEKKCTCTARIYWIEQQKLGFAISCPDHFTMSLRYLFAFFMFFFLMFLNWPLMWFYWQLNQRTRYERHTL